MKRMKSTAAILLLFVMLTAVLPISAMADQKMVVTASWLRLRTGPGMEYAIKARFKAGTIVTVLSSQTSKHWYYVRSATGKTGWMYKSYLKSTANASVDPKYSASGTAVAKRNVNLRTGPSKKNEIIKLLPAGQSMQIIGKTGKWYQVKIGKQTGYVMKSLVKVK